MGLKILGKDVVGLANDLLAVLLRIFVSRGVANTLSRGHTAAVDLLALDPTGTYLFSGNAEGECKIWRLLSGRLVSDGKLCPDVGKSAVTCVHPTGPLGIASPGAVAMMFVAGSDRQDNSLVSGIVTCFQIDDESTKKVAPVSPEEYAERNRKFKLSGYIAPVCCMDVINGEKLAVCTEAGFVWIWPLEALVRKDYSRSVCLSTLWSSNARALYIHENSQLVAGTELGRIAVWNIHDLKTTDMMEKSNPMQSNPMQSYALSAMNNSRPTMSNSPPMSSQHRRKKGAGLLARYEMSMAAGNAVGEEERRKNAPICEYWAHGKRALQGGGINKFATMKPKGRGDHLLFSASGDTTVKIWWLGKSEALCTLRGHQASVTDLLVNADQEVPELFSASTDTTIIMWFIDREAPEESGPIKTFRGHDSIITGMVVLPLPESVMASMPEYNNERDPRKENKLVSCSRDGTVRMWHLPQSSTLRTSEHDQVTSKTKSQIIQTQTVSITSTAKHVTYFPSGGVLDANVVVGTSEGSIQYLDIFPTPQLQKEYWNAPAFALLGPLIDLVVFAYQKIAFVTPLLVTVISLNLRHAWRDEHAVDEMGNQLDQAVSGGGLQKVYNSVFPQLLERDIYYYELEFLACCALIVVLVMVCRVYQAWIQRIDRYMSEEKYMEESASASSLVTLQSMKAHYKVANMVRFKKGVWAFLWVAIKLLTLPLMRHAIPIMDCLAKKDGKLHLEIDTDIVCWQGKHLWMASTTGFVVIVYLFYAIPFTFCGCDAEAYYTAQDLEDLFRHAGLRASKVDVALLTPSGINWCYNQLCELLVKATLPSIAVLFNKHSFLRSALMTLTLGVECAVAFLLPAFQDRMFNMVVIALKLWAFFVFGCASYAGYMADRLQRADGLLVVLVAGTLCIYLVVQIRICIHRHCGPASPISPRDAASASTAEEARPFLAFSESK